MSFSGPEPVRWTFPAAGDISTAQFKFMTINSSGQVTTCTLVTDIPIGVLQNKPSAANRPAEIVVAGITKVQADADLAIGDLIGTSSDGQADAKVAGTDTTEYVVGRVIENTGAAGDYTACLINCLNPHRGA
jgi:hypothetical protein